MRTFIITLIVVALFAGKTSVYADELKQRNTSEGKKLLFSLDETGDTIYLATLRQLIVYPPLVFKNKKQEEFYWKTVRDVKRTLPYAKMIGNELYRVNTDLSAIADEKERKKYMDEFEKNAFKKYEADFRKMTASQGRMLIKLVDRECDRTSYDLIKSYKGGVTAFFWQGIARIFGSNLKSHYDSEGEDKIVERVIALVEAGQL